MKIAVALCLLTLLAGCAYYHVVEEGDTLYEMSREYGVSVQEIQRANPGIDPYNLQIGQRVKIPRLPNQTLSDYTGRHDTPRPTHTPWQRTTPTPSIDRTPPTWRPTP
ncbi:MAG: LysM peptidoglycan-binding domain-containing protein, partial [Alphaproteobacteria bacterium]